MGTMIDLNADLGEGCGTDEELIGLISSANIACGGHAGDAQTMRETVRLSRQHNLRIGAHPGFADKPNFGRKRLDLPTSDIVRDVLAQIGDLTAIASDEGMPIAYVKLHGALANMTAEDEELARQIFFEINRVYPGLAIMALDNSAQTQTAIALHIPFIREAYADRAYNDDGTLVSRTSAGAVLKEADEVVAQCLGIALKGEFVAQSGRVHKSGARSICVHGDTPGAVALTRQIVAALSKNGVTIGHD